MTCVTMGCLVTHLTFSLEIFCDQVMFSILQRYVFSKARIHLSCVLFRCQVLEAHNRTGMTFLLNRQSFSWRKKFFDFYIGFSLLNVPEACWMRHDISFPVDPVFMIVLPMYSNSRTCSMSWLLHLRCRSESVTAILFVLSVLILSPTSWPLSRTAFSNSCSLCLQDSMSVLSLAQSKSLIWCSVFSCVASGASLVLCCVASDASVTEQMVNS